MLASDESARVIAGGQTLVPMMAMRLARPTRLIDISRIAELSYIRADGDTLSIGATTRQCLVERDALIAAKLPLLAHAIPFIGHSATRARGTIGGSLANADPAAELPLIAITLDAVLEYRAGGHTETIAARDFYIGPMTTALPGDAVLTACGFRCGPAKSGPASMRSMRDEAILPLLQPRRRLNSMAAANANVSPLASVPRLTFRFD